MKPTTSWLVTGALALLPGSVLGECQITLPASSPVEVPGAVPSDSFAWYGSAALAVRLPSNGMWKGMGPDHHYRDKLWFWRQGYKASAETVPALTLDAIKLGGAGKPERVHNGHATNAFGPGWSKMLTGMEFPSPGCWQVNARYLLDGIAHELTFVVSVGGDP